MGKGKNMGYLLFAFFAFVTIILILSAFSPMHTDKPFWRTIKRIKERMDLVSYYFLTACLILSVIAAAAYFVLGNFA